jgi:hypothetical protein
VESIDESPSTLTHTPDNQSVSVIWTVTGLEHWWEEMNGCIVCGMDAELGCR